MRLPKFTAEVSLGKTGENYALTSGTPAEDGGVVPQFFRKPRCGCFHTPDGGIYCTCM
jgi:hypothetical protein